jgi:heme-degrading monooxygenase HmoA
MVIVLICRFVKPTEEPKFLERYNEDQRKNVGIPDFICETLTKVNDSHDLPEFMRSLHLVRENCLNYVNLAYWTSAEAFAQRFTPKAPFDEETEVSPRLRVVLEIQQTTCDIKAAP